MGGWKPIETAPRDGTDILVYEKYRPDDGCGYYIEIACWDVTCGVGGWRINSFAPPFENDPTHWMPLPEPPVSGEAE